MKFRERTRDDPRIELTGLVDILFLLIIFFTVTTTFATTGGIDVNLPEAASQRALEKTEKVYVVVNRKGEAFIEGEKKTNRELEKLFKKTAEKNPRAIVILEADRHVFHGRVVEIMDLAQSAGLKRLAIAAEQKREEADREEAPGE